MSTFSVHESSEGRFHVQGFGQAIAGPHGERTFNLVVINQNNKIVLTIENVTAQEMGIKKIGSDYMKDSYRITDFFLWSPDKKHILGRTRNAQNLIARATHKTIQTTEMPMAHRAPRGSWPNWDTPSDEQILRTLQEITPFVQFLDPKIIKEVVRQNLELAPLISALESQGVQMDAYFWDGTPCAFPGVRRFVGGAEKDYKRKIVPVGKRAELQAVFIDDNSYPKEIWSFLLRNRRFSKTNPDGYELAHLFIHKADSEIDIRMELTGTERYNHRISGFFSHAAGCAYIPKSLARVTDLSLRARKLIQQRCHQLYSEVCEILPPGVGYSAKSGDWDPKNFKWAKPISGTDLGLESFLKFRKIEMERLISEVNKSAA